jgi:hypothetical protein
VLVLVHPPDVLAAEDLGVAVVGEDALGHLGDQREDRVVELGDHQADDPPAPGTQLDGALVTEQVHGQEDRFAGARRHPGTLVEDATHRRAAHAGTLGQLGEGHRHAADHSASPTLR